MVLVISGNFEVIPFTDYIDMWCFLGKERKIKCTVLIVGKICGAAIAIHVIWYVIIAARNSLCP